MARLMSELRTTPMRKVEQIRSANLFQRLDEYVIERKGSKVEALEEEEVESSVLFSNHSQTIMLPQLSPSLTIAKNTLQPTSSLAHLRWNSIWTMRGCVWNAFDCFEDVVFGDDNV